MISRTGKKTVVYTMQCGDTREDVASPEGADIVTTCEKEGLP